jgi:glycosyltransferase involved in cell wall biosynthesis
MREAGGRVRCSGMDHHGRASTRRRSLRVAMIHLSDFRYDSRIQRQAYALAERGDTVDLICLGAAEEWRVGSGVIRVHPIPGDKPAGGARNYVRGYTSFLAAATRRLTALERRHRYDLVEVHNMPDALTFATVVPKLHGAAVILNLHDTFPELFISKFGASSDGLGVRLLKLEERASALMADALIAVTDEAKVRLEARGVGRGRTYVVMNSPDEGIFGPQREPVSLPDSGEIRVLYHGGTAPRFGVETLIRSFEFLREDAPRVSLRVLGPGEDVPRLRDLAGTIAPGRVEVVGAVPFPTIPDELRAAHIGVVPTLHDEFTELLLPVKLLEYIHMGLPVVASRLPGIAGYFSGGDAAFCEPGDARGLATAIQDVCANPAAAQERAQRASARLRDIAWEQQKRGYLELVDRLTAARVSR